MPDNEFNQMFAKRLRFYLSKNGMTQLELSKKLGVGTTSVYNQCNGVKTPRMDKVDKMCDIFHCKRSDLIEDKEDNEGDTYYLNPETSKIAQEIYDNKELSLLFDAARDASPDDLNTIHSMLMALKRKEQGK